MEDEQYIRKVQTSVTVFLHHGNEYLMLKRADTKRVDPGKLNGIGGRLDPGENYLEAAIRETEEETGYKLSAKDLRLVTIGKLEGGYPEDWIMCFFTAEVSEKTIPHGHKTDDGELLWLDKDNILDSGYELVDDLNYVLKEILKGDTLLFFNAQVNSDEKISDISISKLP